MPYFPQACPQGVDLDGLRKWVEQELFSIAQATQVVDGVRYNILYAAPTKILDGMTVYADGTTWNPGGGAGMYERRAGAWVKL